MLIKKNGRITLKRELKEEFRKHHSAKGPVGGEGGGGRGKREYTKGGRW